MYKLFLFLSYITAVLNVFIDHFLRCYPPPCIIFGRSTARFKAIHQARTMSSAAASKSFSCQPFPFQIIILLRAFFMPFDGHVRIRNEANYLILNRFLSKFMVRLNPGIGHKLTTSSFKDHLSPSLLACLVPRSVRLVID